MRKVEAPLIEISNIFKNTKKYEIRGFTLNVGRGDSVAVVHKNASCVDLLTEILSGRVSPDKGKIFFKGDNVNGVKDSFGVVTKRQSISKMKTVGDNAAAALVRRGLSRQMASLVVSKDISTFGLQDYLDIAVRNLPANIAARAGIYSAYMWSHEFIVIDEPFAEFDGSNRAEEIEWLRVTAKSNGLAMAVFTENIDTALKLGTSVMVVDKNMRSVGMIGIDKRNIDKSRERLEQLLETVNN